ncbi:6-phosphogluconolactonase [Streptomyces sp. NPDC007162]|uniref:6-phosphogluconolactonase n=1 Tax=Streptomyces sp. NPDC007162 TaxID=3156917 RepID=UPI0034001230
MSTPQLVVHHDKELMAQAAAARLITKIVDAQASRGEASVVLTGGRNGNGLLAALAAAPARDAVDWSRLDLWWGDERYLPEGDPERNVAQAREALLDQVPVDPKRVHAMPASDGPWGADVDAAAEAYAAELAQAADPENHGPVPTFDVLMLGVGPDTHVASLFPELPAVRETERTVVEAFDHEQGLRSRVILPDRCPAAPLRGHRLRIPGTGTVTARLPGGRVGPATRSAPDPGPPLLPGLPVALCLVAVLRGATSLAAIARFAADTDSELREQLGLTSSTPNASTLGRLLARLDGYALDDAVGA